MQINMQYHWVDSSLDSSTCVLITDEIRAYIWNKKHARFPEYRRAGTKQENVDQYLPLKLMPLQTVDKYRPFTNIVLELPDLVYNIHYSLFLLFSLQVAQLPLFISDGKWHHICITWTTRDGMWEAFQDGEKLGTGENLAPWHPIKPGGVLILGQEQVSE